MYRIEQVTEPR